MVTLRSQRERQGNSPSGRHAGSECESCGRLALRRAGVPQLHVALRAARSPSGQSASASTRPPPSQARLYADDDSWQSVYRGSTRLGQDARRSHVSPAWQTSGIGIEQSVALFAILALPRHPD